MGKRIEANVYGHVQGVSFRYYTRREARRLGLTGWVANHIDGTVKVVADGPEINLHQMIGFLQKGPPAARVDKVQVVWQEASTEFNEFSIRGI